jgi:hypothetical protein
MPPRSTVITFTKLVGEPFFMVCTENLKTLAGAQAGRITSIDTIRLEHRVTTSPETWEEAVAAAGFGSLQTFDDGSFVDTIIGGILTADPDADPAPGSDYMLVAECTVTLEAALGGGTVEKVFRCPVRIVAGSVTAPAS